MCKTSGVRVTKVVFRGYFAAPKIQASHDQAISRRTDLQLKVRFGQTPCGIVFSIPFLSFCPSLILNIRDVSVRVFALIKVINGMVAI